MTCYRLFHRPSHSDHTSSSTIISPTMDKGAARSRKQAQKPQHVPSEPQSRPVTEAAPRPSSSSEPGPSRFKPKIIDNTDPSRFRPKAIRESAALIWLQEPFSLPPSPDILSKVTRVDLAGSNCTDISWLKGTKVTWLSLKGCKIEQGLEAVASLEELAGMTDLRMVLMTQYSTSPTLASTSFQLHGRLFLI